MSVVKTKHSRKEALPYRMVYIHDTVTLAENAGLAEAFFDLYEHPHNFPDPDEREPRENIFGRIQTGSGDPFTHLIAYCIGDAVKAGVIAEFYPQSSCILLTYIFVEKSLRGKGVASKLIRSEEGVPGLIKLIENKHGKQVQAVFFETNNPKETPPGTDSMDPAQRLLHFYSLGGKRLDLKYVQPPLDHGLGSVTNLFLCLFPHLTGLAFVVPTEVVMRFLAEFYYSLRPFHVLAKTNADAFLHDLEEALDREKKAPDFLVPELQDMYRDLQQKQYEEITGYQYLHELPRIEEPRLMFERAAVAFEFVVDESYFEPKGFEAVEKINGPFCVVTHSFETDLFAYSYQNDPPYYTRCYNAAKPIDEITVRFPDEFKFNSEGRRETFFTLDHDSEGLHDIRLRVFLNFTWFKQSNIRVWHLVFTAFEGHGLHEYNLIKLMKYFSGAQEIGSLKNDANIPAHPILFTVPGSTEALDLYGLLEKLAGIRYQLKPEFQAKIFSEKKPKFFGYDEGVGIETEERVENGKKRYVPGFKALRTGIVQIDTDYCQLINRQDEDDASNFQDTLKTLYARLSLADDGQKTTDEELQTEYRRHPDAEYVFEAYCGITLGIFDFSRMGYEEVSDTLIPRSSTQSSFLTINRGVLSSFGYDDQVLASSWDTIGINPYLLIPSAVLAANDYISRDADARISHLLNNVENGNGGKKAYNLSMLEKTRRDVINLLNIDFLPNIFQYPTEQDLYEYGLTHRGVYERNRRTQAKLEQIDNLIEECNQMLNQRYQFLISVAATALAVIQLLAPLSNLLFSNFSVKIKTLLGMEIMGALILSALLFGVFVRWWYRKLGLNKRKIRHN
ncbi:MAG: hypothetical protein IT270_04625 [Saprospiraceae bacterium]|nr:hypothetical protein [Saprospiraceae bacterium]